MLAMSDDGTNVEFRYKSGVAVAERSQCLRPVALIWTDDNAPASPVVMVAALSVDDVPKTDVDRIFADFPAMTTI